MADLRGLDNSRVKIVTLKNKGKKTFWKQAKSEMSGISRKIPKNAPVILESEVLPFGDDHVFD